MKKRIYRPQKKFVINVGGAPSIQEGPLSSRPLVAQKGS